MLPGVMVGSSSTLRINIEPRHGLPGSNSGTRSNAFEAWVEFPAEIPVEVVDFGHSGSESLELELPNADQVDDERFVMPNGLDVILLSIMDDAGPGALANSPPCCIPIYDEPPLPLLGFSIDFCIPPGAAFIKL